MGCSCFKGQPDLGNCSASEVGSSYDPKDGKSDDDLQQDVRYPEEQTQSQVKVSAWVWGCGNAFGENEPIATPMQLQVKGRSLRGFGTAWDQTLLVANSGALWAAGVNDQGLLFEERSAGTQRAAKVDLLELEGRQVDAAAGGKTHIITILEDGEKLLSWGSNNEFGQLGHGVTDAKCYPPRAIVLPPKTLVRQVACGEAHSLVLTVAGSIYSFGDGSRGALGLGSTNSTVVPVLVDTGDLRALPIRGIDAGSHHSLALSASGEVTAWGCGVDGRLGIENEAPEAQLRPRRVGPFNETVLFIAAGGQHSAVILRSQKCFMTGSNEHGQLGQHPSNISKSDMFLHVPGSWRAVALGNFHSVLLRCDGLVYACGRCDQGQLGGGELSGLASSNLMPIILPPDLAVVGIATGPDHALLLASVAPEANNAFPLKEDNHSGTDATAANCSRHLVLSVLPGVCTSAKFGELTVSTLEKMAQRAASGGPGFKCLSEEFLRNCLAVFCSPTLMNSSFCFEGADKLRLNSEGFLGAFTEIWQANLWSDAQQAQLRSAAMQGMERWAGDPKTWTASPLNLTHKDQVRGLGMLLLCPFVGDIEKVPDARIVMARLIAIIAGLPYEGRRAFIDTVADDMASVLRGVLVARVRAYCNLAINQAVREKQFSDSVWEGLFVLDFFVQANAQINTWIKDEVLVEPESKEHLKRKASWTSRLSRRSGETTSVQSLSAYRVPGPTVPANEFELEALTQGIVPPEIEYALFVQNAKKTVVALEDLLRLRVHDSVARSFITHWQLLPASFVRRVVAVENRYQQNATHQLAFQEIFTNMMASGTLDLTGGGLANVNQSKFFFPIHVRRDNLLEDTLQVLQDATPSDLQKPLMVHFHGEEGQDAGGVSREFFRLLSSDLFSLESGFFDKAVAEEARLLWFDYESKRESVDFWMMGVVLGLAVYNNLPGLDAQFPASVFKKIKGEMLKLQDLAEVLPAVASSLKAILAWEPDPGMTAEEANQAFIDTFCLDFTVSYAEGEKMSVQELTEDGSNVPVTCENRQKYVETYIEWVLNTSVAAQFEPFKKGFGRVCNSPLLQALKGDELARIVIGETDIGLEQLKHNVVYDGYTAESRCITWFWKVVEDFDVNQRRLFLSFLTGSDRSPVGGLGEMRMTIQRAPADGNTKRLPTAHTCFNLLVLPEYPAKETLKGLLLIAISNAVGFGLE